MSNANPSTNPAHDLKQLLSTLLSNTQPENITQLLSNIDTHLPWAQKTDPRLAHYLERRSYQKALAHFETNGTMPHKM